MEESLQVLQENQAANEEAINTEVSSNPHEEKAVNNTSKVDDEFLSRVARIAAQEKRIHQDREALKSDKSKIERLSSLETAAKNKDYKTILSALGIDFGDLLAANVTGHDPQSEIEQLKRQVNDLLSEKQQEKQSTEAKKAEEERQKIIASAIDDIKKTTEKGFPLIKKNNAYETVLEVCGDFYKRYNKIIPYDQAAKEVESYLQKQIDDLLEDDEIKTIFSSKFQPKQQSNEAEQEQVSKTISNSDANISSNFVATSIEDLDRLALMELRKINQNRYK